MDFAKIYRDELAALCLPGEEVRALTAVTYVQGEEDTGPLTNSVSFDPVNGLSVESWDRGMQRGVAGTSLRGPHGSNAWQLARAASETVHLVVTNGRIWVLRGLASSDVPAIVWARQLGDVVALRHDPHWNQWGRIRIDFRDGSTVRLVAGFVFVGKARRLARAFREATGGQRH